MKSIERRFINLKNKRPEWSLCVCFSEAVYYQKFSDQAIHRWFSKLVDRDEFSSEQKKDIIENLERGSNALRTTENEGEEALWWL